MRILFIFLLSIGFLSSPNLFAVESALIPKLFFEHGYPFDGSCEKDPKQPITETMENELDRRLPVFQKLWDTESPKLLKTTVDFFKLGFGRQEESVTLVLCPWFSPMSSPFMLRVREYLKSATVDGSTNYFTALKPESYFVSQVYHELLHRYLDRNFGGIDSAANSSLIKKYEKERRGVLIHLHLLALQKAVYLKLNPKEEITKIVALDSGIPGDIYKRSWEIVNTEGYEKFMDELKAWHRK